MTICDIIKNRRSIRSFLDNAVTKDDLSRLIEAASWAPSGKNIQPWRFAVVADDNDLRNKISELTIYRRWVKKAPCLIIVFLDRNISYDYEKDVMAIGASIQNLLLAAYEMQLGACWVGEILKNKDKIKEMLGLQEHLEMVALVAVGYTDSKDINGNRRDINENVLLWK